MANKKLTLDLNVDTDGIKEYIDSELSKFKDNCLTRDQAIKRIRDIKKACSVNHLELVRGACLIENRLTLAQSLHRKEGAVAELMAIFDIKEEEI